MDSGIHEKIGDLKRELQAIDQKRSLLKKEIESLTALQSEKSCSYTGAPAAESVPKTPHEKIDLFLSLFCCRDDVYPHFWKNRKTGKTGYSPVCSNEWKRNICFKPKVTCTKCENQAFKPFDAYAVHDHVTGKSAIGSYAINETDSTIFLAADFDKSTWKADIRSYVMAAKELEIQVSIEISKSGNGAHAWIFFDSLIDAKTARRLGEIILSKAMKTGSTLSLDSYDRFFPNQDLLPSGGFGNLIALPLQYAYREQGTSVFVTDEFIPYNDQWAYLASVHRLSRNDIEAVVYEYFQEAPAPIEIDEIHAAEFLIHQDITLSESYDGTVEVIHAGQTAVPLDQIPGSVIHALKKMGTIANPKFFAAQRMRFSTWNISKYIFCGDNDEKYIYLPRGLTEKVIEYLNVAGFQIIGKDKRNDNEKLELSFSGTLHTHQQEAVEELLKHDLGVLVSPTGTGKTVMAVSLLARRNCRTLILVHRSTLIPQWIDALCRFIPEIEKKQIGVLGGGRKRLKGLVDIAMLQSAANVEELEEMTRGYDFLIVDECHRVPTATFEPVLKSVSARYVLGLTATPQRKDQFQSIIFMHCGPVRFRVDDIYASTQLRQVFFRQTAAPDADTYQSIQQLWEDLVHSDPRNRQIIEDALALTRQGRSPVIICDRTEHMKKLQELLYNESAQSSFTIKGEMGKKERRSVLDSIQALLATHKPFILFATGSLIGEGFDLPELDTMLLTMPISFKGRLTQYVGRLHRQGDHRQKHIIVYDYVDTCSGMTISMFKKRITTYRRLGYDLMYDPTARLSRWVH